LTKKSNQRKQAEERRLARKRAADEEANEEQQVEPHNNDQAMDVEDDAVQEQEATAEIPAVISTTLSIRRFERLAHRLVIPQVIDEEEQLQRYWVMGENERKRIRVANNPERRRVVQRRSDDVETRAKRRKRNEDTT